MISKTEDKASQEKKGEDSEGKEYKTIQDMWKHEIIDTKGYSEEYKSAFNVIGSKKNWYKKANDYWTVIYLIYEILNIIYELVYDEHLIL